jgi:hypothetical protein
LVFVFAVDADGKERPGNIYAVIPDGKEEPGTHAGLFIKAAARTAA